MLRTLLIALSLLLPVASALADVDGGGYGWRRAQADSDPRTLAARAHFDSTIKTAFGQAKQASRLPELKLTQNLRMIAQYGRGAGSANQVLPIELARIVKFISLTKSHRDEVRRAALATESFKDVTRAELETALTHLAETKIVNLDYWGYLGRTERLPTFAASSGTLTYFAKWNEGKSYYSLLPEGQLRLNILKGLISSARNADRSWWPF